jgi:hypothetical protein
VGYELRSSGLLCLEASQARVSQSDIKTSGGTAQMVHMTSSQMLRRVEAEDGRVDVTRCIGPCTLSFSLY